MRKNKVKTIIKKNIFGFILGAIIFGPFGVYAATTWLSQNVTYDNSSSGMSALNVQDAIDELYNAIPKISTAAETLLETVVTSGDGLYADAFEDGRYIYRGAAPNNYITFNGEEAGWRIISVEADGTLKIIRNSSIGDYSWDENSTYVWSSSSLKSYLTDTYYPTLTGTSNVQTYDYAVGAITDDNSNLVAQIAAEKATTWNGYIGLMTVSDYIRSNTNTSKCGTHSLNQDNSSICATTTWIQDIVKTGNPSSDYHYLWTMNTEVVDYYLAFLVISNGLVNSGNLDMLTAGVAPVLFLKSDITLSGSGTTGDPYTILTN